MDGPADTVQVEPLGLAHAMHAEQQQQQAQQQNQLQHLVVEADVAAAVAAAAAACVPVYVLHGGSPQCAVWTLHDDRFLLTDHSYCPLEPQRSVLGPELASMCGYDAAQWTHVVKVAQDMAGQPSGSSIQQVFEAAVQQPGALPTASRLLLQDQALLPPVATPAAPSLQLAGTMVDAAAAAGSDDDNTVLSLYVKVYVEKTVKVHAYWTNAVELLGGSKKLPTFIICKPGTWSLVHPRQEVTGGDIKLLAGYANPHKWYQSVRLGQPLAAEGRVFEKDSWVCKVLDVVRKNRTAAASSAAPSMQALVGQDSSLDGSLQPGSLLQGLAAAVMPDNQLQSARSKRRRGAKDIAGTEDEEQTASDSPQQPQQPAEDDEPTDDGEMALAKRARGKQHTSSAVAQKSTRASAGVSSRTSATDDGGVCLTYMNKEQVQEYSLAQLKSSLIAAGVHVWEPAHWTVYCYKKSLDGGWKVHYRLEGMGRYGSRATAVEAARKKYASSLQYPAAASGALTADAIDAVAAAAAELAASTATAATGHTSKAGRGRGRSSTAVDAAAMTGDPLQLKLQVAPLQLPPLVLPLPFQQQFSAQLSPETQRQQALAADGLLQLLASTTDIAAHMQLPAPAHAAMPTAADAALSAPTEEGPASTTPVLPAKEEAANTAALAPETGVVATCGKLTALPELQVAGNQATLESQNAVLPALVALLKELGCSAAVRELMQQVKERYSSNEQGMKDFVVHYMSLWAAVDLQDAGYVKDVLRDDWGLDV